MFKKILPGKYGHAAFYVKVRPHTWFRVYKIEHLFSTVAQAYIFVLHISYRHLRKLKHFEWANGKMICFDCDADTGDNILSELKQKGKTDISLRKPLYWTGLARYNAIKR